MKLQKLKTNKKETETIYQTIKNFVKETRYEQTQFYETALFSKKDLAINSAYKKMNVIINNSIKRELTTIEMELYKYYSIVYTTGEIINEYSNKYGVE